MPIYCRHVCLEVVYEYLYLPAAKYVSYHFIANNVSKYIFCYICNG